MKKLLLISLLFISQLTFAQFDESLKTFTGHSGDVNSVAFSPDGKTCVSASSDNTLKLWDIATGQCLKTFIGHTEFVSSVDFSSDGKIVLSGSGDKTLKIWDVATGVCMKTFIGHTSQVSAVAFNPDGRTVLSGSADKTIKLWSVITGLCIKTMYDYSWVNSITYSPDGKTALSGNSDAIRLWDVISGVEIKTVMAGRTLSVAFSPDGKTVFSSSTAKTITLWNAETLQHIKTFTGHSGTVASVKFSLDGKTALSGSYDKTLKLWDIATGQCLKTFTGHSNSVYSVAFSPDGKTCISVSSDKTLKLWDVSKYATPDVTSNTNTGNDTKPVITNKPPILAIAKGSIRFTDANNNNAIDAFENCKLVFEVSNNGLGNAYKLQKKITLTGTTAGITAVDNSVFNVNAGEKKTIEIPVKANSNIETGKVTFSIKIDEANGFGTDEYTIEVPTRKFVSPLVEVADYTVTGNNGNNLKKKSPFDLQVLVQNTQQGLGENVKVELQLPANVLCLSGNEVQSFTTLKPGETKSIVYSLIVSDLYQAQTIPVTIKLAEKLGKYAQNKNIQLTLDQALATDKITVTAKPSDNTDIAIIKGSLNVDVDVNIPTTTTTNDKTFVVIIANENYQRESKVDFAVNDGKMFKAYCEKTLGIPSANIHYVENATYGNLLAEKDWLSNVLEAGSGSVKGIFYYAGHGIPNEQTKSAYLLPVDGNSTSTATALSLDDLYNSLGQHPSKGVTVFLDACFSGSTRDNGALASARSGKLKPRESTLTGNLVVFSAATGDETAWPYRDKQHGLFTYYLLKKLQETKGDVTYKDLIGYLTDKVKFESVTKNSKSQTPTVNYSPTANPVWEGWKLK